MYTQTELPTRQSETGVRVAALTLASVAVAPLDTVRISRAVVATTITARMPHAHTTLVAARRLIDVACSC